MGLIIDTNIFINAENGRYNLESLRQFKHHGSAYISAITVSELFLGVHLAQNDETKIKREIFVENIVSNITVIPFTEDIARVYSRIYAIFLKPRSKLDSNVHDLQIAATALANDYPIVTCNGKDFNKIPGLRVLVP